MWISTLKEEKNLGVMAAQQSQGHFAQGITIRTSDWGC